MKFRKTALAIAVASVAAAPMASQADVTLSGILEIGLFGSDDDTLVNPGDTDGPENGELSVGAGDVRINVAAEQELNNGLTGYGNYRVDADGLSNAAAGLTGDSLYAGIRGDFGDVRVGETPVMLEYGQLANDIFDVAADTERSISYEGNFGPVKFGVQHSPARNDREPSEDVAYGVGVEFAAAGFTIGLGAEDRDENQNFTVGASYGLTGFDLSAHYWSRENSLENSFTYGVDARGGSVDIGTAGQDFEGFALRGVYGVNDLSLGLTYATLTPDTNVDTGAQALRFDAGYDMGGGMTVSTRITQYTFDDAVAEGDPDLLQYRVIIAKTF